LELPIRNHASGDTGLSAGENISRQGCVIYRKEGETAMGKPLEGKGKGWLASWECAGKQLRDVRITVWVAKNRNAEPNRHPERRGEVKRIWARATRRRGFQLRPNTKPTKNLLASAFDRSKDGVSAERREHTPGENRKLTELEKFPRVMSFSSPTQEAWHKKNEEKEDTQRALDDEVE